MARYCASKHEVVWSFLLLEKPLELCQSDVLTAVLFAP
jgi:hypothetical protein